MVSRAALLGLTAPSTPQLIAPTHSISLHTETGRTWFHAFDKGCDFKAEAQKPFGWLPAAN